MGVEGIWLAVGFLGQAFFSARFIVQWIASERRKQSVVPVYFWYFSLGGGLTLFLHAVHRLRTVFQSRGEVFVLPGSGRTALEAGATSVIEPGDRVVVVVAGQFGALMREILVRAGAEVTEFTVEGGRPLDLARLAAEAERVRPKAIHRSEEHTSELQSHSDLVCRLLLEKKKNKN